MLIHYCNDKISHPGDKGNVFIFSKKEKKRKEQRNHRRPAFTIQELDQSKWNTLFASSFSKSFYPGNGRPPMYLNYKGPRVQGIGSCYRDWLLALKNDHSHQSATIQREVSSDWILENVSKEHKTLQQDQSKSQFMWIKVAYINK